KKAPSLSHNANKTAHFTGKSASFYGIDLRSALQNAVYMRVQRFYLQLSRIYLRVKEFYMRLLEI
ncbi:hypothetical protein LRR81_20845, partial [Metabacillus sp. GX 13764]|uniref:hypothetical protein n=1 Tax=Metabacillus kandeliae TaxID=2900151 RepID=UPI001E464C5C